MIATTASKSFDRDRGSVLSTRKRWLLGICFFSVFSVLGCGPDSKELLMKSAMRKRQADPDEKKAEAKKPKPKKVEGRDKSADPQSKGDAEADQQDVTDPASMEGVPSARLAIVKDEEASEIKSEEAESTRELLPIPDPIEIRKMNLSLDLERERNEWAYDGLTKIGQAILDYEKEKGQLPRAYTNKVGVTTLSWRVLILPYLGYEELYKEFDLSKQWYIEPNKSLLDRIPNEFVSPERQDSFTNFVLPTGRQYLFGSLIQKDRDNELADPLEGTIMLIEADDRWASAWTSPSDFNPKSTPRDELKSIRGGGAFALWGDGTPFLLLDSVDTQSLEFALTATQGDRLVNRKLQVPIPVEAMSAGSLALDDSAKVDGDDKTDEMTSVEKDTKPTQEATQIVDFSGVQRLEVPGTVQLLAASDRLRQLFRSRIDEASKEEDKKELAMEWFEIAKGLDSKPAERFALLKAAETFATDAGDASLLIKVADYRVRTFEVDPFKENMSFLNTFIDVNGKRQRSNIEGLEEFLQRSLRLVFASYQTNAYGPAMKLVRNMRQWSISDSNEELEDQLNRLRVLLGSASLAYKRTREQLDAYRIDPENEEAAAAVGQFLCFFHSDWERGLPLLQLTDNKDLAAVIKRDLKSPTSEEECLALGDAWWRISKRGTGVYRQAARDRAKIWYDAAYRTLPDGLDKLHVENRLQEYGELDPGNLTGLFRELAAELQIDLGRSLAAEIQLGDQ